MFLHSLSVCISIRYAGCAVGCHRFQAKPDGARPCASFQSTMLINQKEAIPSGPFRLELFIEGMGLVTSIPTKRTIIIIIACPKQAERRQTIA